MRAQCRGAKERLSTSGVASLMAEVPGHRSEVRLTRTELDDVMRQPLADFADVLQDTLERNGIRGDLVAVASAGGGARIPIITTTLSERFRVPVITSGQPELTAAIGGGLAAVRGTLDEGNTSMAAAAPAAAAAAVATTMAPEVAAPPDEMTQSAVQALAWSDADHVPDVTPSDPYDYSSPVDPGGVDDVRPQMQFQHEPREHERGAAPRAWYRRPEVVMAAGVVVVLVALGTAVLFVTRSGDTPPAPASTTVTTAPPPTSAAPAPPETQAPPPETVTQEVPPPVTQTVTAPPPEPPRQSAAGGHRAAAGQSAAGGHRAADGQSAAGGHRAAAAGRTDAAVRDHSRSAVRSGTDSTAATGSVGQSRI